MLGIYRPARERRLSASCNGAIAMQTTGEILHILFVLGLPTLALVGIGVWVNSDNHSGRSDSSSV